MIVDYVIFRLMIRDIWFELVDERFNEYKYELIDELIDR